MTIEWKMESKIMLYSPVCTFCRHATVAQLMGRACDAFPAEASIPLPIWQGENGHVAPYPGDNGIQFERRSPEEEIA